MTREGNLEHETTQLVDVARRPRDEFAVERGRLLATRGLRIPPGTDRKRVVAWNALAISGLARAGSLFGDDAMLADAVATADFVLGRMCDEHGRLLRVYNEGARASRPSSTTMRACSKPASTCSAPAPGIVFSRPRWAWRGRSRGASTTSRKETCS